VGPVENYSSDLFTVDEVHKIAVLDLRLLNLDRNPCNILVQQTDDCTNGSNLRLIPIDHGLTLPDCFQVSSYDLVWMSFSQAEAPLSQRTMDYIQAINVDDDIKFIESRFAVRPICLRNMKISTLLLQQATQRGLSLFEIGRILCRPDDDDCQPSILEQLVAKSEQEMATEDLTTLNFKKFAK
jgi:hypothetical protein